ncbi:MAG: hypothetical protein ACI8S6_002593 [Myxococcota bacterium]|jgi:hypothetical protein
MPHWTFEINKQERMITVPDKGGQADMIPREPEQLAWAVAHLEPLAGVARIWPTVFQAASDEVLGEARQVIATLGEVTIRER